MPIYEYRCTDCEQIFEEWQKDYEQRHCDCPMCGGQSQRLISHSAFVLKGSGWYTTDYCNRGSSSSDAGSAGSAGAGKADGSGNGSAASSGNGSAAAEAKTPSASATSTSGTAAASPGGSSATAAS